MKVLTSIRSVLLIVTIIASSAIFAADYDPDTMTVSAASLLEAESLKGTHYSIANDVLVSGFINHYTVNSDFGEFIAIGNRNLKKLLHEIDAIAELKSMNSAGVGIDAAVDVVTDTGKSLKTMATHPVDSVHYMGGGLSRLFKRTTKTITDAGSKVADTVSDTVSGEDDEGDDDAGMSDAASKVTSSYLGIGKAQREIARELEVDPYSDNPVLQAELARVAKVSGTVGKITNILIPIPSVVGIATDVSDMVWKLSPTDLLIQNQETLEALGYSEELIQRFFSNKVYSPTEQTAFVAAVKSLNGVKGREVLLEGAVNVVSEIEGEFMVRAALFAHLYDEQVDPITELLKSPIGSVPVAITRSGNGLIFAPLDMLLWTEDVESTIAEVALLMDEHGGSNKHLLWIEGDVSALALASLEFAGWVESSAAFDKLHAIMKDEAH